VKEGWTRPKENTAKHPLKGADGVVVSSYRLSSQTGFDNGLKQRYMKGRPSCGWLSSKNDDQQRLRVEPTKGASYEV
jgi:hypothetical protein